MTETAGVIVALRADVAELERGMQRAQRAVDRAAGQIERRADRFSGQLGRSFTVGNRLIDGFEREMLRARNSAEAFQEAFNAERTFGHLEQALNPAIRALRQYEAAQETVSRAVAAGTVTQQRADAVLAQAQAQYQRTAAALGALEGSATTAGRTFGRSGSMIQQAGFQVGDFATQIASGQSPLRAFIQQGTQLVSMFGPWGAVIGAGGAIIGALAVGMLDAAGSTKTFEDRLTDLQSAIDDLRSFDRLIADLDALKEKYGEVTEAVVSLIGRQRELRLDALQQETRGLLGDVESTVGGFRLGEVPIAQLRGPVAAQVQPLLDALEELDNAEGFKEQADAAAALLAVLEEIERGPLGGIVRDAMPDLRQQITDAEAKLREAANTAGEIKPPIDGAGNSANTLAGNLGGAAGRASELAGQLERAASALSRMSATAQNRLATAQIRLQFRGDPEGAARAEAEREAGQAVAEAQRAANEIGIPSGLRPQLLEPVKENARETVDALVEAVRLEQQLAALSTSGGSGGGGGGRAADEPDPAVLDREVESIREKIAALQQERELLLARASAQAAGIPPEEIARQQAVLTAAFDRQRMVEELLNKAKAEGLELTSEKRAEIEGMAESTERLTIANFDLEASIRAQGDAAKEAEQRQENLQRAVEQVGNRFASAIQQADSFSEALRNIGIEILNLAAQGLGGAGPLGDILGNIIPSLFGAAAGGAAGGKAGATITKSAMGNAFDKGRVTPFASGGIVSSPTLFPMANGMGLMGEAGPEAILPLTRIGGKLGVRATGGGRPIIIGDTNITITEPGMTAPQLQRVLAEHRRDTIQQVTRMWAGDPGAFPGS